MGHVTQAASIRAATASILQASSQRQYEAANQYVVAQGYEPFALGELWPDVSDPRWSVYAEFFGIIEGEDQPDERSCRECPSTDYHLTKHDGWSMPPCEKPEEFVFVGDKVVRAGEAQPDLVEKPSHYTRYKIEPITFIMRNDLPFHVGNIVKYAARAGHKLYEGKDAAASEITDLRKVIRYAEMRINQLEGKTEL